MSTQPFLPRLLLCCVLLIYWAAVGGRATCGQPADLPKAIPQPNSLWPTSPIDVIVVFDRPIDPTSAAKLVGRSITFEAGKTRPSGSIRIAGADLLDDGRTVHLATDPHPLAARYTLLTGDNVSWNYDLSGVEASWSRQDAEPDAPPGWTGWLPLLDLEQSRTQIKGSVSHDRGFKLFQKAGQLTLATQAAFPKGRIRAEVTSSGPIEELIVGHEAFQAEEGAEPVRKRSLEVTSAGESQFLLIRVRTTDGEQFPALKLTYRLDDAPASQSLTREQMLLPWAPTPPAQNLWAALTPTPTAVSLAGGNAAKGETLFHGDQAQCARCHRFRGKGGGIGPDLTSIAKKGAAEIYQSIATPSSVIEPNYVAFTVSAKDGRVIAGIVHADGPDAINVSDTNAKSTRIARRDIDQIRPASASIMPVGLASALGEERVKDLIAFLMSAEAKP